MSHDQIGPGADEPIPDVIAPITGYRMWNWDDQGLLSQFSTRWTPGEAQKAECKASSYRPSSRYDWTEHLISAGPDEQRNILALMDDGVAGKMAVETVLGVDLTERPVRTRDDHLCPGDPTDIEFHGEHGCGLYAYSTIEDCWKDRAPGVHLYMTPSSNVVFGEVELWGRVWPHAKGYRAEYMRPTVFYRRTDDKPAPFYGDPIEKLAELHGCRVEEFPMGEEERKAAVNLSNTWYVGGVGYTAANNVITRMNRATIATMYPDYASVAPPLTLRDYIFHPYRTYTRRK